MSPAARMVAILVADAAGVPRGGRQLGSFASVSATVVVKDPSTEVWLLVGPGNGMRP